MNGKKRLRAMLARNEAKKQSSDFPLPEGKSELYNYRGEMRRWNTATGHYDLPA